MADFDLPALLSRHSGKFEENRTNHSSALLVTPKLHSYRDVSVCVYKQGHCALQPLVMLTC